MDSQKLSEKIDFIIKNINYQTKMIEHMKILIMRLRSCW